MHGLNQLIERIQDLMEHKVPFVVAIDGPCGSGKSTLAEQLHENFADSALIHVDDFFLQSHQRTQVRLSQPGGNMDRERLVEQVLSKMHGQEGLTYERYNCQTGDLHLQDLPKKALYIVEGSYAHHPELIKFYDLKVFLDISSKTQLERLQQRNPQMLSRFVDTWIPMEQEYFKVFNIRENSDLILTEQ